MRLTGVVTRAQELGNNDTQEDRVICIPFDNRVHGRGYLLSVLDGHGGAQAAEYCSRIIPKAFDAEAIEPEEELERLVAVLADRTALMDVGTTVSLAWISESERVVVTAVVGDSPIIVLDAGGRMQTSVEHNARSNPAEREAALTRGAAYRDGYLYDDRTVLPGEESDKGLQLTRALGDSPFRNILSRKPSIERYRLGSASIVIVGSDGVFDYTHEGAAGEGQETVLKMAIARSDAQRILLALRDRGLEDNASLIIWRNRRWWERFT